MVGMDECGLGRCSHRSTLEQQYGGLRCCPRLKSLKEEIGMMMVKCEQKVLEEEEKKTEV